MQNRLAVTLVTCPARLVLRMLFPGVCLLLFATARPASAQQAPPDIQPPGQIPLTFFIQSMERGHADLSLLQDGLAKRVSEHSETGQNIRQLGALKTIKLRNVTVFGFYFYDTEFERGHMVWRVGDLSLDGRIGNLHYWTLKPDTREDLREFSCVGPARVAGTMIWANIIEIPELNCPVGGGFGQFFGGSGGTSRLVPHDLFGPEADLVVPINIVFRDPGDAGKTRLGARATVRGNFFMVNDVTFGSEYLEVRDAVIEQGPASEDITLPNATYASTQPDQPLAKQLPRSLVPPAPDPRAESVLRQVIVTIAAGKPDYGTMTPAVAEHLQHVQSGLNAYLRSAGAILSMTLLAKSDDGGLVYAVAFEKGGNQFSVRLNGEGRIDAFSYGPHLAEEPDQTAGDAVPAAADAGQARPQP